MKEEQIQEIEPVVIGPSNKKRNFVYSEPLKGDLARQVYEEGRQIVAKDYKNAPAFNGYRKYDEKKGEIIGSSTFWGIVDDNVLRRQGLWLPGLQEARKLGELGKLTKGVYRDFGVVVYNDEDYNTEIGGFLVSEAKKRSLKLPLILPFRALDLRKAENNYGVEAVLIDELDGVISGDEVIESIKGLHYKVDSGVHRLGRGRYGNWSADWDLLANSDDGGRVDRFCGEATRENLSKRLKSGINALYDQQINDLKNRLQLIESEREKAIAEISDYINKIN